MTDPPCDPSGQGPHDADVLRRLEEENAQLRRRLAAAEAEAARHGAVAEGAPIPMFTKDLQGRYTWCNAAFEAQTGWRREHFVGKTVRDILPPEAADFHEKMDREMFAHPAPQAFEHVFRPDKTDSGHGLFVRAPLRDGGGTATGVVCAILDLTERKAVEEALRQSERRLELILRHSTDGINICEFSPDLKKRRLVLCNDRFVEMSGRTREELMAADNLNQFVRSRADREIHERDRRRLLDSAPMAGQGSWIRPDGKENYYEWTGATARIGDKVYVIGIDRDVSERHLADRALRESEEKYRTVVEAAGETIAILDEDGTYLFVNCTGAERLDLTPGQLVGKALGDVFPRDVADRRVAVVREVIRTGQGYQAEVQGPIQGEQGWERVNVQRLPAAPGAKGRALLFARDITQRKKVEQALRESEEKYRTLVESAGAAICQYDVDGGCLFMNAFGARRLGCDPSGIAGKTMWDLFPKEYADRQMEMIRQTLAKGEGQIVEVPSVTPAGRRWFRTSIEPLAAPPGEKPRALVFARDVTAYHDAQDGLDRANRRLAAIVENSWDVIFEMDLEGKYTYGNPAAERMTGYPLAKIVGTSLFDLVTPEFHEMMRERLRRRVIGQQLPQPFQFEIVHRRGHRVFVELVTTLVLEGGKAVGIQGIARDITDRLRAERELRQTRERLEHLISASPAAIYCVELSDPVRTTYASPNVTRIFGYTPQQMMDRDFWCSCVHPEDLGALHQFGRHGRTEGPARTEYRFRHADRAYHWMLDEINIVRSSPTAPPEAIGHVVDITALKQAEEALREAHRQLVNAREKERKRLASDLHDSLGQELISLHLKVQGLLADRGEGLGVKGRREADEIVRMCQDAIAEVRSISHGLYPPLLESVGLAAALREMAGRLASPIPIQVDCAGALEKLRWPIEVEIALFRIAQEALRNAVRHSRASRIKLTLKYKPSLRDRSGRGTAVLSIRDDGVGFDPRRGGGGLGLLTMTDRAETVGGKLVIESRPGSTLIEARVPAEARRRDAAKE